MVGSAFSPPNILIVDDVNTNLAVLTEMLHSAGYIARPVMNARQAVSAIEAMTPNLILLDISMPEIDGFTFCSMLKKSVKTRDIPVIFISALDAPSDRVKGFQSGAVDFITKPFEVPELMLRINHQLRMHKIRQELEAYNKKLNKIINEQIRKIHDEQKNLIIGLTKMMQKQYNSREAHMNRVGRNSRILALSLQLSPDFRNLITNSFIDAIEIAAPLHDIGVIGISERVIHKSTAFNEEEKDILKTHTVIGAELLGEIYASNENNELLKLCMDIAKYHHECWDGSGYPEGINGDNIPLSARIVAVVVEFDNLLSEGPRRTAHSQEKCIELMNQKAGIQFDPDIISVFNKIQNQLVKPDNTTMDA